jgi:hypothetical protein
MEVEVTILLLPNVNLYNQNNNYVSNSDPNFENNSENLIIEQNGRVKVLNKKITPISVLKQEQPVETELNVLEKLQSLSSYEDGDIPGIKLSFGSKFDKVYFSSDLVSGLDLSLTYHKALIKRTIMFEEDITYNPGASLKFKDLILNNKAYLKSDENLYIVPKDHLSYKTNMLSLNNARVILFWRDFSLETITAKKLITHGLLYLMELISEAELTFYIKKLLSGSSDFSLYINKVKYSYVVIGIEGSLFT